MYGDQEYYRDTLLAVRDARARGDVSAAAANKLGRIAKRWPATVRALVRGSVHQPDVATERSQMTPKQRESVDDAARALGSLADPYRATAAPAPPPEAGPGKSRTWEQARRADPSPSTDYELSLPQAPPTMGVLLAGGAVLWWAGRQARWW